jgi:hypothetical protein
LNIRPFEVGIRYKNTLEQKKMETFLKPLTNEHIAKEPQCTGDRSHCDRGNRKVFPAAPSKVWHIKALSIEKKNSFDQRHTKQSLAGVYLV